MKRGLMMVLLLLTVVIGVQAQPVADTDIAFAAVIDNALVIHHSDGTLITVDNPPHRFIESPVWNADGSKLAYLLYDQEYEKHIMVTDSQGSTPVMLDTGRLEAGFPITFTPDDDILYVAQGEFAADGSSYHPQLMRIAPEAGAAPQVFGPGGLQFTTGCGGGSPLPQDWQYWSETAGFGGNFLTLTLTDYGLLYSMNCGGLGLGLLDMISGETRLVGPEGMSERGMEDSALGRAALSPDGTQVAAMRAEFSSGRPVFSMVIVDLATLTLTDIATEAQPDQLTWGEDNMVYFSSRVETGSLLNEITAEEQAALNESLGYEIDFVPVYEVGLHRVNPATGEESYLWGTEGYAIGRMMATGNQLVFSMIDSGQDWVTGLADGSIDIMQDEAQRAAVPVWLYVLDLDAGHVSLIGADVRIATVRP